MINSSFNPVDLLSQSVRVCLDNYKKNIAVENPETGFCEFTLHYSKTTGILQYTSDHDSIDVTYRVLAERKVEKLTQMSEPVSENVKKVIRSFEIIMQDCVETVQKSRLDKAIELTPLFKSYDLQYNTSFLPIPLHSEVPYCFNDKVIVKRTSDKITIGIIRGIVEEHKAKGETYLFVLLGTAKAYTWLQISNEDQEKRQIIARVIQPDAFKGDYWIKPQLMADHLRGINTHINAHM